MAVSGDNTWFDGITGNDIILAALRKIGEYDAAETVATSDEYLKAAFALNALIKEWTADGIGLWLRQSTLLILRQGMTRYKLGPSGTTGTNDDFHAFPDSRANYSSGTLDVGEPLGETVMSVDGWFARDGKVGTTPVAGPPAWNVGVRLDDGGIHWSTATASGATSVTLNVGLPSAAAAGRKVYTYLNRTSKVIRIVDGSLVREDTSGNAAPIDLVSRVEYETLSRKQASGDPVKAHFDPRYSASSQLLVWPVSNSLSLDKVYMVSEHYADNINTSATDNFTFPDEWANALIWNLAHELSYEYGVDRDTRRELLAIAGSKKFSLLTGIDRENNSLKLSPEVRFR